MLALGMTTACGQQNYTNTDVERFAKLKDSTDVIVIDVRTTEEFNEGHIEGAINIDQKKDDFINKVKSRLPINKTYAIYCRSGRRSANAAAKMADHGYKCINLKGGIIAWKEAGKKITTEKYEVDVFKTKNGKEIKFHALVHASIRIEYDGKEIEIDPVGKIGNKTIDYSNMPKADYIFITHEHGDHFDKTAINILTGKNTQLIMNARCTDMYGSGTTMANGNKIVLSDDITVEAVPAYNITEANKKFHPKGRDNGYILTIDGLRIYIAGDTEDIKEMNEIKNIDIAFLPCNQPYTMTPEQFIKAAKIIRPKVLFPYHFGNTVLNNIPSQLWKEGIDTRIRHYE